MIFAIKSTADIGPIGIVGMRPTSHMRTRPMRRLFAPAKMTIPPNRAFAFLVEFGIFDKLVLPRWSGSDGYGSNGSIPWR